MENIEYSGYWWLPSDPDKKIAGTLTFTNDEGIKLQLMDSFLQLIVGSFTRELVSTTGELKSTPDVPIILGFADRNIITLCDSTIFSSELYYSKFALIGRYFTKPDELLFNQARVEYSYLSDWADLPRIREETKLPYQDKEEELRFIYTRPETIEGTTKDGKFSLDYSYSNKHFVNIDFKQFVSFIIQPNEELSFKDFHSKFIHPLNNFITFATDRTNCITELKLYSRHGHLLHRVNSRDILDEIPIEAIYQTIYPERKKTDKLLIKPKMLFSLSDIKIKSDFSSILEKWFDSWEKLDSIFNLFFSIRYKPDMYLENKFINLVQAAESYHRRRINRQILPDDEYKKRRKAVLDSLDSLSDEYKQWAKEKLQLKNDPGLKQRLIDLTELIPEVTNQLINDKESFYAKITATRNDFVHDNKTKNKKSAKLEELPDLIELLSFILQACFLMELGFNSEECYQLLNRNLRYQEKVEIISSKRRINYMKNALDIARYFLCRVDREAGDTISPLKLQKLVYYAQAWSLVFRNKPLFFQDIEAWVSRPIICDVWDEYKPYHYRDIPPPEELEIKFAKDEVEVLEEVWDAYGELSARHLKELTHSETPWLNARKDLEPAQPSNNIISQSDMKAFYSLMVEA